MLQGQGCVLGWGEWFVPSVPSPVHCAGGLHRGPHSDHKITFSGRTGYKTGVKTPELFITPYAIKNENKSAAGIKNPNQIN